MGKSKEAEPRPQFPTSTPSPVSDLSSTPSFPRPLPPASDALILTWRFPSPYDNLTLTGRSRAAWHTAFVIPQLDLLLDAGLVVNKTRPKRIFITHGHSDHTLLGPCFTMRQSPPDVFCPVETADLWDDYCLARTMLNLGSDERAEREGDDFDEEETDSESDTYREEPGQPGKQRLKIERAAQHGGNEERGTWRRERTETEQKWLNTHLTYGIRPGDVIPFREKPSHSATAFACDHTVPSLGYLFNMTTHRLAPAYQDRPGQELAELRKQGTNITRPHVQHIFAFLGDGTARTLREDPQWLQDGVKVVITECSFLREEHRAQAERTKHTLWAELEPVVRRWTDTVFVLTHFSMRYKEGEVVRFFREMEDCPGNIVVWADGNADQS